MTDGPIDRIELNGAPVQVGELRTLALVNYGHFTSMQVRERCVCGLDMHLDRLVQGTHELFGCELDRAHARECLRHALGAESRPLSARVTVFARTLDRERPIAQVTPDILVCLSAASKLAVKPVRIQSFRYQRELPQIKHAGTFPLFHYRRLAQGKGFDDALFVDADGVVSEGSTWNIGFHDGQGIVWPQAPQLAGVAMRLLQAGLVRLAVASATRPIRLQDVANFRAAFLINSNIIARPIACIDDVEFAVDAALMAMLEQCYVTIPWEMV
jgi:branched-subunit amino acid aminotransferase/4-amino-4-deoxychorismate lyase